MNWLRALLRRGAPAIRRRPIIVVLGMMTRHPVGGIVWLTMQYVIGLARLGYDVYYVEAHAGTPKMFASEDNDGSLAASAFLERIFGAFDLNGRWAYHALHSDGAFYGLPEAKVRSLYREAALILNLHGGTTPRPEHTETGRLVYVGTDPVDRELRLHDNDPEIIELFADHCAHFTWGENYGRPDCLVPVSTRFRLVPTRQPIVMDQWQPNGTPTGELFTTVGSWRQLWREVKLNGEAYSWSKHHEFLKFIALPQRTDAKFELALAGCSEPDRALLEEHGWRVRDALAFTADAYDYRGYIFRSRGEFTVAKDQNVRMRSGWFSDRSASYLASGRPVITQDTGFGSVLPAGDGLFAYGTLEEAVDAVARVNADYPHHSRAARRVAEEYFSHDRVLPAMLTEAGL